MREYIAMWKNYANFSGKATRGEYTLALLVNILISCALIVAVVVLHLAFLSPVGSVYALAVCVPTLSLYVRRLRDAGMSWLWVFALPVPLVGIAVVVLLACKE